MPQEINEFPDDLREVERLLGTLAPAPPALDRNALLYEAGRAAGKRAAHPRLWQGLSGLLAAVALFSFTWPRPSTAQHQTAHTPPVKVAPAQNTSPAPEPTPALAKSSQPAPEIIPEEMSYLAMRKLVLNSGTSALRWDSPALRGGSGNAPGYKPALTPDDPLNALPPWQQRRANTQGDRL